MPPIISKLPSAHSNGLTPRSCKKNDSNNDVISDYYAGVSKRLKESESNGFASARVGCNRICNINSIHAASEELPRSVQSARNEIRSVPVHHSCKPKFVSAC